MLIRRDTKAWKAAGSGPRLALSRGFCTIGLACLPGSDLDRAFMIMGYVFCLSSAFALAKFIRDDESSARDTPMWLFVVWGGFALAVALTGWGLVQMEISPTYRAFLGVSWLFLVSSDVHPRQDPARRARSLPCRGPPSRHVDRRSARIRMTSPTPSFLLRRHSP